MKLDKRKVYTYEPVLLDLVDPPYNIQPGDRVKIKHLYGCPKPGTMGMTHVVHADTKEFAGLVSIHSLKQEA